MTEKLCGNCPYNPVEQMIRGGDESCPDAFKEQAKYCNYNYNCQKHGRRLIDAEALIAALLETRREETETTLKLVRFIRKQPTIEPTEVRTFVSLPEPKCADGCIYGWGSDECEKCRFKCEPKRGRWIEKTVKEGSPFFWRRFYCTACGDWTTHGKSKFCPNCGARMESENEID